jgi:hypothetical protein
MGLNIINEKLNELLGQSTSVKSHVEINYHDLQIPSFEIITEKGRTRFSIEKGKRVSDSADPEVMNILGEFYKFSKHTLIHEWNQYRPQDQSHAIEQFQFDLDIPTTQTLQVFHEAVSEKPPIYQIKYQLHEERQIIKLEFTLFPVGVRDPIKISYRTILFLLNNLGPVSDNTIRLLIKKLHLNILMDAVFYSITSSHLKVDLVVVKKFIKEHKPVLTASDDLDIDEFLPVYDRPYTTRRNVRVRN